MMTITFVLSFFQRPRGLQPHLSRQVPRSADGPVLRLHPVPLLQEDIRDDGREAAQGGQDGAPRGGVDATWIPCGHLHHLDSVQLHGRKTGGRASESGKVSRHRLKFMSTHNNFLNLHIEIFCFKCFQY